MAKAKNMEVRRYLVLERGSNKCAKCGSSTNLHAHHVLGINNRPDLKLDLDNGLALCAKCHHKLHAAEKAEKPKQPAATKIVTLRITEYEYTELKAAYAKQGLSLSTGMKAAALWLLQSGATVTRAGVMERRS